MQDEARRVRVGREARADREHGDASLLHVDLEALDAAATTPVAATSEAVPAASLEAKQQPKADAKRT